jgi:hypothetical protein
MMTDEKAKALRDRLDRLAREMNDLAYGTFDSLMSEAAIWREKYFVLNTLLVQACAERDEARALLAEATAGRA